MITLALITAILCGFAFVVVASHMFIRAYPQLAKTTQGQLQRRGQKLFNLPEFQRQHALVFASTHMLSILLGFVITWSLIGNPLPGFVVGLGLYLLPERWFQLQRKRRLKQIERELPDALLFIASALRAGSSLAGALQVLVQDHSGPLAQELSFVLREQRLGVSFDDAIQRLSVRVPIQDLQLVVVALRVSKEVGGNLSEPLQILADTLRKKTMLEGRIDALTAQGRVQGVVMTGLPVLLTVVLYFIQPNMKLLFTTTVGWIALSIATVMLILGYAMIKKIVSIDI